MKHWNISALAAFAVAILLAIAPNARAATSAEAFVKNATIGNLFEIQTSQLALDKSQNADVKQFAQRMIDDHGKARNTLKATVSTQDSVDPLATAEVLDSKHQKALDKLKAASAKNFDKEYISAQKDAHDEAVSLFRKYAKTGGNTALKQFAANTLPTLEDHQKHVKQLKAK